jgi:adenylate cyclase
MLGTPNSFRRENALFTSNPALRRLTLGIIVSAAVAVAVAALCLLGVFDMLEYKTLDARFKLFPFQPPGKEKAADKDVVVFVIDEKSLLNMEFPEPPEPPRDASIDMARKPPAKPPKYGWPWRREVYGWMVMYANLCGAKAVVIDLDFSSACVAPGSDELFGMKLNENSGIPVYTVMELKNETDEEFRSRLAFRKKLIEGRDIPLSGNIGLEDFNSVYPPVEEICVKSHGVGVANFHPDSDGIARRMTLLFKCDGKIYPVLPLAVALDVRGAHGVETLDRGKTLVFRSSDAATGTRVPLEGGASCLIKWYDWLKDPKDCYTAVALYTSAGYVAQSPEYNSATDKERQRLKAAGKNPEKDLKITPGMIDVEKIVSPFPKAIDPKLLKDKIVFIGAQASSLADNKSTPVDETMPGVCVLATALQNLLSEDFIYHSPRSAAFALLALFSLLTGVTCTMLVPAFKRLWVAAIVLFVLIIVYIGGFSGWAAYNFAKNSLWMDVVPVWAGIFLAYAASTTVGYVTENKGKREFKKAFGKYLSPEVVEELSKDFAALSVNTGTRQDLTVLFSDIRGFTPMSEKMQPEEVVTLLNEYLSAMVDVIFRNGGFLDKYIGDGIMAVFTAPRRRENHAQLAVRAACEMLQTIDRMKEDWAKAGKQVFEIGIGINSGEMVVGNIGSEKRMDYTAIGDNVNLAARLESLNKQYGSRLIVSEETYSRVRDYVEARDLGLTTVKGKGAEIRVFEITAWKKD